MMKLNKLTAAIVLTTIVALSYSPSVSASEAKVSDSKNNVMGLLTKETAKPKKKKSKTVETKPVPTPQPVVVEYVVGDNDNLTKIAEAHQTTVDRLWNKNTGLADPNLLKVGDKLVIPNPDEQLADRPQPVITHQAESTPPPVVSRGVVSGNSYDWGNCTWYVKNRRADLPNNLGNADTWYYRAQAQGIPVGSAPRVGAVAQSRGGMHVAYVESVNGDGTVTVSEMNVRGLGVVSTRTAPASNYLYIY